MAQTKTIGFNSFCKQAFKQVVIIVTHHIPLALERKKQRKKRDNTLFPGLVYIDYPVALPAGPNVSNNNFRQ